jgi:hypothetical protein
MIDPSASAKESPTDPRQQASSQVAKPRARLPPFTFAVLADTHIRPEPVDVQGSWPSDALQNDRNRRMTALLARRRPDFAIHLGDVTHTLPCLPNHESALRFARDLLSGVHCTFFVAPGNHDVGDKPDSTATAPVADDASHRAFEAVFGPSWRSFDHGGCHFVLLDASALGTDGTHDREQRSWLEHDLPGHERIFVFLHYPPYILDPDEPSHYDDLPPEPRAWLLSLLDSHRVEALFAGHTHTFFFGRHGATELYTLPSVAFCRPEYAELYPLAPGGENGRDDPDKLGFFLVHVKPAGFFVELVRTATEQAPYDAPAAPLPLGVWLRGGWARVVDLPCGDLDAFTRKRARNDQPLLTLWELGVRFVRIPLSDLAAGDTRARLLEIGERFPELYVFSVDVPRDEQRALVRAFGPRIRGWEIMLREAGFSAGIQALRDLPAPLALSVIPKERPDSRGYFSHFPQPGFVPGVLPPVVLDRLPEDVRWLVFRIPSEMRPMDGVARAALDAAAFGRRALVHVEIQHGTERLPHTDDAAVAERADETLEAARAFPEVPVFLDLLEDKDRGYHPRHGLCDRRGNPRAAARLLRRRSAET